MKRPIAALIAGAAALAVLGAATAASADPKWGDDGPPGRHHHYKGRGRDRDDDRGRDRDYGRGRYDRGRHGGPPPWAAAWGRRERHHRVKYHRYGREYSATTDEIVVLPQAGIGNCNRDIVGALVGAAAGGALGSQVGKGGGRTAAIIGGSILGALVGGNIGRAMDQVDQGCVGQVLERAPTGQPVVWQNPDQGGQYQVTPTRTYEQSNGRYCREYQTQITIGGRIERGYGTACRQPDGSWQKVN